jgi:hypothetical protein
VTGGPIAFLFLGELLLFPHLFPIVEALAMTDAPLDLWVSTAAHEELLAAWAAGLSMVRLRRPPGFREARDGALPPKLPMLAALAPQLARAAAVVCAEQTSLWLPTVLPFLPPFVKTSHGVGSMSARDDRRRRAAAVMLVPGERERRSYLMRGFDPNRVVATGYVKASFRQRAFTRPVFPDARPVVLYAPHWQAHRSSWPAWGEAVVRRLADDGRFNAILAPHQRLVETAPEVRDVLASVAGRPNVHVDLNSFALVDGSYTEAADIYLGDTSSQVVEFLVRPRPCVFLNPGRVAWQGDPAYDQWRCGEVVEALDEALPALARANPRHPAYTAIQADFARSSLGDLSAEAPRRAAREVLRAAGLAPEAGAWAA